ncbi:MAG: NAD(P)H-dependent oxidoreductase [Candidatus Eisenbacteria bacterium]
MAALRLLGISGSLRRDSFNTALLRTAVTLLPDDVTLELRTLHGIPLYDGDVEAQGIPAEVRALREAIHAADGLVLSSPEYNNSLPGVFKNTIDWLSRGAGQPFAGKPVVLMSASPGGFGGARAQLAWLPVFAALGAHSMHSPQFYLSAAHQAFAPDGALAEERTREQLRKLLATFARWCRGPAAQA